MTAFETVVGSVGPVLLLVGFGVILGRRGKLDVRPLLDWVIYIGQPALIIHSLSTHPVGGGHLAMVAGGSIAVVVVVAGLAQLYARLFNDREPEVPLCATFANAANIPLPLALFAFGEEGLSHQIVFMTTNAVLLYTLGVAMLSPGRGGWKLVFRLPLVYATLLGLALSYGGVELPAVAARPVKMLGDTAIPLMLFALGFTMGRRVRISLREVAPIVVLRILGGGAVGLLFVWLVEPPLAATRAILLGAFMPPAVQSFMLSAKFSNNPERAAAAVFVATLLAAIYVPLLVTWLHTLGG